MARFTPKRADGRPVWRVAFDHITHGLDSGQLTNGSTVTHEELARVMEARFPSSNYYVAVGRATRELQRERNKTLVSERGTGYKITQGLGMVDKSRDYQDRAQRNVGNAIAVANAVDESDLSSKSEIDMVRGVRRGFALLGAVLAQHAEHLTEHDRQIERLNEATMTAKSRHRATEDEIAAMRDRLDRLEAEQNGS